MNGGTIRFSTIMTVVVLTLLATATVVGQSVGDYQSQASGEWTCYTTWQKWDGAVWQDLCPGMYPGKTVCDTFATVRIRCGNTVAISVPVLPHAIRKLLVAYGGSFHPTAGPGGFTLTFPLFVNGMVDFSGSASDLVLGNNSVTIQSCGGETGAAAGKCFVTNGTGAVKKYIAPGSSFTASIGPIVGRFNPVTFDGSGHPGNDADTLSFRVGAGVVPAVGDPSGALGLTWYVNEGIAGGDTTILSFGWSTSDPSDEGSTFSRAGADLWLSHGSGWSDVSAGTLSGTNPYVFSALSLLSDFGNLTIANAGVLPVQLSSMKALAVNQGAVSLHWETVSEINNYGFEIWRSADPQNGYVKVSALIPGHGTTLDPQEYDWTDNAATPTQPYYRLRQINLDQTVKEYEPVRVVFSLTGTAGLPPSAKAFQLLQNYPNPFNPTTEVKFSVERSGPATLVVYNSLGEEVATLFNDVAQAGRFYTLRLDATRMASGVYFCRLESNAQRTLIRMALVR